jgi:hypothetical protein
MNSIDERLHDMPSTSQHPRLIPRLPIQRKDALLYRTTNTKEFLDNPHAVVWNITDKATLIDYKRSSAQQG